MSTPRHLVVIMSHGPKTEKASVGFTFANGGMTAGMNVTVFLTADAVDIARRGALETAHFKPLDPLDDLVKDFLKRGGTLFACTPCVKARGYAEKDLIDGAVISGASPVHKLLLEGAASASF